MLRLSRLADYGFLLLGCMLQQQERLRAAPELAAAAGLPLPVAAKVLKRLARAGVLGSRRGAGGGYVLARSPWAVTVAEVIAALDGPVALTACVEDGGGQCGVSALCPLRGRWGVVNDAVRAALESVTLAEMIGAAGVPGAVGREGRKGDDGRGC